MNYNVYKCNIFDNNDKNGRQMEAKLFGSKEMTPANNSKPQEEKNPRNANCKSSHKNL